MALPCYSPGLATSSLPEMQQYAGRAGESDLKRYGIGYETQKQSNLAPHLGLDSPSVKYEVQG